MDRYTDRIEGQMDRGLRGGWTDRWFTGRNSCRRVFHMEVCTHINCQWLRKVDIVHTTRVFTSSFLISLLSPFYLYRFSNKSVIDVCFLVSDITEQGQPSLCSSHSGHC